MEVVTDRSARRPVRDDATAGTSGDAVGRWRRTGQGAMVGTVALVAALVVALVSAVLLSIEYAQRDQPAAAVAAAGSSTADRREVQDAAAVFAANLNTYSVQNISDYRSRIMPLLTDGFGKSFELAVDNTIAMVKATKMSSQGEVLSTAVTSLDARAATALVVADSEVTSRLGDRQRHFRWRVTLLKQGDMWLVDNFTPVA